MNDPQTWTALGILATALLGALTLTSSMVVRIIHTEIRTTHTLIGALHTEMSVGFSAVGSEIQGLRREMQAELASVRTEIKHLDRDVQALSKRVFGDGAA